MRRRITPLAVVAVVALLAIAAPNAIATAIPATTVSDVTTTSATLKAEINPEGKATKYHFEYGLADCAANPCASTPEGKAISGSVPVPVEALLEGLNPGTTYHFRAVAGATKGPDATLTTQPQPPVFGPCSNDAFRTGALSPSDHPSSLLPDCRAYEQASPTDKNGGEVTGTVPLLKASPNGDAVSFVTYSGIPGGEGGQELPTYVARRGASAWSSQGMLPPAANGERAFVQGWTPDFSQTFSSANTLSNFGTASFFARFANGSLATIVPYGSGVNQPFLQPSYAGSSADGSVAFLELEGKLTGTNAVESGPNVYAWDRDSGKTVLASVMNDEQAPPGGAFSGAYDWIGVGVPTYGGSRESYYTQDNHAISGDGSLYFTAGKTGQLYLRENPTEEQSVLDGGGNCTQPAKACTIQISGSEKNNGHGPAGADAAGAQPAAFMAASTDGSKAFFTSSEKLTNDATTGPEPINSPAIARAKINGEGTEIEFLPAHADGIAVFGEHIYWADPETHAIGRAKLNGAGNATEVETQFIPGAGIPHYVALNSEYIYWSNAGDGKDHNGTIARAKLDGSEVELNFITGASNPQGVAVNLSHLYWANDGENQGNGCEGIPTPPACVGNVVHPTQGLGRADLDGSNPVQLFVDSAGRSNQGIAANATYIFHMPNRKGGVDTAIMRLDLEGEYTGSIYDAKEKEIPLEGVALDSGHVYWASQGKNAIGRNKLAFPGGTNVEPEEAEFVKDAGHPKGVAVDSEHIYWAANQEVQPNRGNDLYRYDTSAPVGERLTDLTPDPSPGDKYGAEVKGVIGTSADGSYVYFVANGDLDGAGPAAAGDCTGSAVVFVNFTGECSIYLSHAGTVDFIARLDGENGATNWLPRRASIDGDKTARVSADGTTLLFTSGRSQTSYENHGRRELYRYRVGEPGLLCVSCNPTNEPPGDGLRGAGLGFINFPAIPAAEPTATLSRNLSADGNRIFFETTEALVASDTNGEGGCLLSGGQNNNGAVPKCKDVYEWEADGSGSCKSKAQNGGCLYLLSSGKSTSASYFVDASANGDDVFLVSRSGFVGQDGDQLFDVYDARVGGGLASQNEGGAPVPCEAEGCRPSAVSPPQSESAGSVTFSGPGDPKPPQKPKPRCPQGKRPVRSKGKTRCLRTHHKRNAKSTQRNSR